MQLQIIRINRTGWQAGFWPTRHHRPLPGVLAAGLAAEDTISRARQGSHVGSSRIKHTQDGRSVHRPAAGFRLATAPAH